eukprot:TRINITY_DN41453_c0_g1_i1.p1 TRINITY_DN41453_c0_g1~~TRINITY_DN41453_c0_g1_i1.p1  ORF type:complete len:315 (+),score=57.53 TRINITY_DN41453_c0_g1_i1:40-984(+)
MAGEVADTELKVTDEEQPAAKQADSEPTVSSETTAPLEAADHPESAEQQQQPAEGSGVDALAEVSEDAEPEPSAEDVDAFPSRPFTPAASMGGASHPAEEPEEEVGSSEPAPVTPEEVLDMAAYLGIDVPTEYDLLWIAKQAVIAPLPRDWDQFVDESGNPYFHSRLTGTVTRQHPSDRFFLDQIKDERQLKWQRQNAARAQRPTAGFGPESSKTPWMEFIDEAGKPYFYHVLTHESSDHCASEEHLGVKAPQPSDHSYSLSKPAILSSKKREMDALELPPALAYKSWYIERGQKHYMDAVSYTHLTLPTKRIV